jgi:hypothetical protein
MKSDQTDLNYIEQLESAARAVTIHSPTSYSWFGAPLPELPSKVRRAFTPSTARTYLLHNLQSRLYESFYCTGSAAMRAAPPVQEAPGMGLGTGTTPFVEQLSSANSGKGYLQGGWTLLAPEGGYLAVTRSGLSLWVPPEVCEAQGAFAHGVRVRLRQAKEMLAISPGYYLAMGDHEIEPEHFQSLVRLYWNVSPAGAITLMRLVTERLNALGLPFRLKVVNNPHKFNRRDTAVLYLRKADYGTLSHELGEIHAEVGDEVRQGAPALTRPLARGVALAEDPGHGESYGLHRAMLVAEGLVRAYEAGEIKVADRLQFILDRLVESGLDPAKPYLKPDSVDEYDLLPSKRPTARDARREFASSSTDDRRPLPTPHSSDDYLLASHRIGTMLARQAVWYGGQCNWLGVVSAESPRFPNWSRGAGRGGVYSALGRDLYDGTSGIGLYLAELWSQVRVAEIRKAAMGALNQALSRCEGKSCMNDLGLYTGWPGIALAAVRAGLLLQEEEPVERACSLLRRFSSPAEPGEHDLLSGSAGAVVALLLLREWLDEPALLEHAAALGDRLLEAAQETGAGYSWPTIRHRFPHNLTGLSHGAAGIGYALLELHAATGEASYRQGAEQAFAYERAWFDAAEANWPDLRWKPAGGSGTRPLPFVCYWCHGAAGIALSRLRAYRLLRDEIYLDEAKAALQTTRRSLGDGLRTGAEAADFSLCHGLLGLSQVLLHARQVLGDDAMQPDTDILVASAAAMGVERYTMLAGGNMDGALGLTAPGLMLGYAGMGLFYLGLCNPATVPVLFLHSGCKRE